MKIFIYLFLYLLPFSVWAIGKDTVWTIDLQENIGKIKPLHGVNGGPFYYSRHQEPIAEYHKGAGFPYTRLHDANWPHPDVVDVPAIFPDFDANPNDPKNYYFKKTDDYLQPILKNKSEIIFRLGVSIEHVTKYHLSPPSDYAKWVRVCTQIIRHYNEGWADGFHYNIRYWEIYNEPDNKPCWTGTQDEFFDFFKVAAKGLKKYNAKLKIGGPAFTNINSSWVIPFLKYCQQNQVPLDFFSWHAYYAKTDSLVRDAQIARNLLDKYGYNKTESHLNEWHYLRSGWQYIFPGASSTRAIYDNLQNEYDLMKGPEGAVFSANVLMKLQDSPVDVANFFAADYNPLSMFSYYGVPSKVYYAFKQFNTLFMYHNRVGCKSSEPDRTVTICAGKNADSSSVGVLLTNSRGSKIKRQIRFENLQNNIRYDVEVYATDQDKNMQPVSAVKGFKAGDVLDLNIDGMSVLLIELKKESQK
ncbi:hypothetical protein FW774_04190 (plasmid) [Pedobacter sp. BS3]|uniref:GH39 family glycosyl hydrolase n=1 Tax=Pedobacter sp. BS3 TaxID=2567937 RepID=UPI0011ECBFFD|nr:hypothetical protein [Pedobacter sp. BS3]TZF86254.1 hypothetical protein FW774_04190 [Pedobacter sp. BS3]